MIGADSAKCRTMMLGGCIGTYTVDRTVVIEIERATTLAREVLKKGSIGVEMHKNTVMLIDVDDARVHACMDLTCTHTHTQSDIISTVGGLSFF